MESDNLLGSLQTRTFVIRNKVKEASLGRYLHLIRFASLVIILFFALVIHALIPLIILFLAHHNLPAWAVAICLILLIAREAIAISGSWFLFDRSASKLPPDEFDQFLKNILDQHRDTPSSFAQKLGAKIRSMKVRALLISRRPDFSSILLERHLVGIYTVSLLLLYVFYYANTFDLIDVFSIVGLSLYYAINFLLLDSLELFFQPKNLYRVSNDTMFAVLYEIMRMCVTVGLAAAVLRTARWGTAEDTVIETNILALREHLKDAGMIQNKFGEFLILVYDCGPSNCYRISTTMPLSPSGIAAANKELLRKIESNQGDL